MSNTVEIKVQKARSLIIYKQSTDRAFTFHIALFLQPEIWITKLSLQYTMEKYLPGGTFEFLDLCCILKLITLFLTDVWINVCDSKPEVCVFHSQTVTHHIITPYKDKRKTIWIILRRKHVIIRSVQNLNIRAQLDKGIRSSHSYY